MTSDRKHPAARKHPDPQSEILELRERIRVLEKERKDAQNRSSEQKSCPFRYLVEHSSDPFYIISPADDFRITHVNEAAVRHFGRSREELLRMSIPDWDPLFPRERCYQIWDEIREKRSLTLETLHRNRDGEEIPVQITAHYIQHDGRELFSGWIHDIRPRRQAEEIMRRSESQIRDRYAELDQIYRYTPVGLFALDREYRFQRINERMAEINGFPMEHHIGRRMEEILPELSDHLRKIFKPVMEKGEAALQVEFRGSRPNNPERERYWLGNYFPLRSGTGEIVGLIGAVFEITERKRAEKALRQSEKQFRQLAEALPQLVWVTRADGYHEYFNRQWFEYTGTTYEDSKGDLWLKLLHPDDYRRTLERWRQSLRTGEPYEIHYRFRRAADGQYRWFLGRALPVRDEQGRIVRWFGSCTDIHDQRKAQEALRRSETLYRAIAGNIPDGAVWVIDRDLRCLVAEGGLLERLGLQREALEGRLIHDVFTGKGLEIAEPRLYYAFSGETASYETEYQGLVLWSQYVPLRDENGSVTAVMILVQNIVERKRMEVDLRKAKEAAEEATRAKSEFLANMSHEIRTPMTVFMAALEYLLQIDRNDERRQFLEMAEESAQRLRSLIEDILDFSRVEARRLDLLNEPFDLRDQVEKAVELLAIPARKKDLSLKLDIAPDIPDKIVGDPDRLGQILINLVGNAVKFTEKGEVNVSVETRDRVLHFSVSDTGIGIPKEKMNLLFESFSQVDSSHTRKYGGTGLGLAISKGLVELMGGRISVRSRDGQGSVFSFTLPLKIAEAGHPDSYEGDSADQPASESLNARILLVEDDPLVRDMILMVLARRGWPTDFAVTGDEAVEKWREGAYDLILMDIQMPGMSGLEATRKIRELEKEKGASTCIIGLTAHARREMQIESESAGMDGFLTKPVKIENLYSIIEKCLSVF